MIMSSVSLVEMGFGNGRKLTSRYLII